MAKDLRKFRRFEVHIPRILCQLHCQGETRQITASVIDFSFGGMCVESLEPLEPGTFVEIFHRDFPCAQTNGTTSQCRVTFVQPAKGLVDCHRMGMAFEAADLEFVENMLRWAQMQKLVQKRTLRPSTPSQGRY